MSSRLKKNPDLYLLHLKINEGKKPYLKYKQYLGQVTSNFFVQLYYYSRFVSTILCDVMVERTFLHAIRQILKMENEVQNLVKVF